MVPSFLVSARHANRLFAITCGLLRISAFVVSCRLVVVSHVERAVLSGSGGLLESKIVPAVVQFNKVRSPICACVLALMPLHADIGAQSNMGHLTVVDVSLFRVVVDLC